MFILSLFRYDYNPTILKDVRFRMYPTDNQAALMAEHCAHARYVWNLGLEQRNLYRPSWGPTPNYGEQSRQLTEARSASMWLAAGSFVVQQQALRDLNQAFQNWLAGTNGHPTWRKAGVHEGFRVVAVTVGHIRRLNRRWAKVFVPKIGWVRFRWTRPIDQAKSYRVTLDPSGRWHIAFAVIPSTIPSPQDGSIIGIDRGVRVTLALSDGTMYQAPADQSVKRRQRQLARAQPGSNRRVRLRTRLAKAHATNKDVRKDWVEKTSTQIARNYDLIRVEDLQIKRMTRRTKGSGRAQKARFNRAILTQGWGLLARRLEDKAAGRFEKVDPAFTSQRCSCCGEVDRNSRESQAQFRCTTCGYSDNADVNAAKNIAAGYAVSARRGLGVVDLPVKREPIKISRVFSTREDAKEWDADIQQLGL